jgi:hypothetical protein
MTSGEGTVITELHVPDSDDVVVLLDPEQRPEDIEAWHPFHNILRLGQAGEVRWRSALPPESTWKCYLSVEWVGGELIAEAPSYKVTLDPASGSIIESVFTK